jgi:hypothetical protein
MMSSNPAEIDRRTKAALAAIRAAYGTEDDEHGVTLFVSHHLEEVEGSYWKQHLQSSSPEPSKVLDLLVRSPHWDADEGGIDSIDFTLPDEVTNYVICVSFDDDGEVEGITMES